jgi:hypothetical protein
MVLAERHAGIDALIGKIELTQAPKNFLNIDRIGPPPDLELTLIVVRHDMLPRLISGRHIGIFKKKRAPLHQPVYGEARSKKSGSAFDGA